ncbi:hypothetical protein [Aurantimonas sp. VKM B-3413]|uniref:hypothetical protein n=1 Tax=Aurantimonas sp. VKM B-3413 TaxID=2779401 RepID=UPI001E2ADDFE|nr:hypothetical protein [Aurantimonas sp. VKM B-3413]MCB8837015.1 hypothetical protein [Aurantimonas sp. VKM B-3413]
MSDDHGECSRGKPGKSGSIDSGDAAFRPSDAFRELLDELDATSLWEGLEAPVSGRITEAALNALHAYIRRRDRLSVHAQEVTRRETDLRHLVRATVFKAEASAVPGYLETLLDEAGLVPAQNAKTERRAINAAVLRLLSATHNNPQADKYRISRCALAMVGLERLCDEHGMSPTIGNADTIFAFVRSMSRTKLCAIAEQPARAEPSSPDANALAADAEIDAQSVAETTTSDDVAVANGAAANYGTPGRVSVSTGAAPSEDQTPSEEACNSGDVERFPPLATVSIPLTKLARGKVFLLVAQRAGTMFRLRGPIQSHSDALGLLKILINSDASGGGSEGAPEGGQ